MGAQSFINLHQTAQAKRPFRASGKSRNTHGRFPSQWVSLLVLVLILYITSAQGKGNLSRPAHKMGGIQNRPAMKDRQGSSTSPPSWYFTLQPSSPMSSTSQFHQTSSQRTWTWSVAEGQLPADEQMPGNGSVLFLWLSFWGWCKGKPGKHPPLVGSPV